MNDENRFLSTEEFSADGYRVIETLGQGGFGTVFRACQQSTGQAVAVKVLRWRIDDHAVADERRIARFQREMEVCARLHHPNIVRLIDSGQSRDGRLFLVFELVAGETLRTRLMRGALSAVQTAALMGQVLDALACAHRAGVVHRDLKPDNIMVVDVGTRMHAKVLDFGMGAVLPDARGPDHRSLTLTQEILGTPAYSAPEQLRGEPPGPVTDLYAWGLVFLECLTGRRVMNGMTVAQILHKQLSPMEIPLPAALAGHGLGQLLRRVLRKHRRDRVGDAALLAKDLARMHFNDLVGELIPGQVSGPMAHLPSSNASLPSALAPNAPMPNMLAIDPTAPVKANLPVSGERRQLTVLCSSLSVTADSEFGLDWEALEAIQQDQLNLCTDTVMRYGGCLAGTLGDRLMVYFGHPQASDTDARRAARTALELAHEVQQRSALLMAQQGVQLTLRVGIHTGAVLLGPDGWPSGLTPNIALRLESLAQPGSVLVSDTTRRLLDKHLEFEDSDCYPIIDRSQPLPTFLLVGEHRSDDDRRLFGRASQLRELHSAWTAASAGHRQGVLITGEAGIGKSRLVREFDRTVLDHGGAVFRARCLPEHRNNALYPILEMFRQLWQLPDARVTDIGSPANDSVGALGQAFTRIESALARCQRPLNVIMPVFCAWFGLPRPERYEPLQHSPQRQKELLLQALVQLISGLGRGQPLLFIIEDLHWTDPTSLELINKLIDKLNKSVIASSDEQALLVVLTARPEFTTHWPEGQVKTVHLSGLQSDDAAAFVRDIVGDKDIDDDILKGVVARTDGVPLFVEALMRMLLDRELVERDGQYVLEGGFEGISVPVTLRDLLTERLDRLGPARATAQLAAAIGREFEYPLLAAASDRDEGAMQADLAALIDADLAVEQRRVGGSRYLFRHALIRDAAYESMLRATRESTHARIAKAMDSEFPELARTRPAELGRHYAAAQSFAPAVEHTTRAARESLDRSVNAEAIAHASKVLRWVAELPESQRVESELRANGILTQALMANRGWADAEVKNTVDRSRLLVAQLDDSEYTVPMLWSLYFFHYVASHRQEVRAVTEELVATAKRSGDRGLQVAAGTLLGLSIFTHGNYADAMPHFERAVELYDRELHRDHGSKYGMDSLAIAITILGQIHWHLGDTTTAFAMVDRGVAWARELDHIPSMAIALLYASVANQFAGNRETVAALSGDILSMSKEYGLPAYEAYAAVLHCWATDDLPGALAVLDQLECLGCKVALSYYSSLPADIEAERGRIDEAIAHIDRCLTLCRDNDEYYHEPELYRLRALYQGRRCGSDTEEVRVSLERAIETARRITMPRTEAWAICELFRHKSASDVHRTRLLELSSLYPGLMTSEIMSQTIASLDQRDGNLATYLAKEPADE